MQTERVVVAHSTNRVLGSYAAGLPGGCAHRSMGIGEGGSGKRGDEFLRFVSDLQRERVADRDADVWDPVLAEKEAERLATAVAVVAAKVWVALPTSWIEQ